MGESSLERIERLFAEALELAPQEQRRFLDSVAADDPDLKKELEELLGVSNEAAAYFDALTQDVVSAAPLEVESAASGRMRLGPYQTLAAIGRGGMGAVFRAERIDGAFDQQVALKLLHRDMDTPGLRARFVAERQLLAQLSHPHIARLQDGGVTSEGRPYFVMEYVEGQPITHYNRDNSLSVEALLRLFLDVIDAVSYLHRNLVVHRDLKPSNIFVDDEGQVKLLDFGIAKLLAEVPDQDGNTRTGELLMTPEYAAPEQLLGHPVTTATDVYALGVVLYELLTGKRPHAGTTPLARSLTDALPPTPSSLLRTSSRTTQATEPGTSTANPSMETLSSWRRVAGDLDSICLMALRPEPEARYASAEQLGQDIERFLEGLPVKARAGTFGYRAGKFVKRHLRSVLATAGLLAIIAAGFVHERGLRDEAEQARSHAQSEAAKAVAVSDFLGELLSSANPENAQGREVTVAEVLDEAASKLAQGTELASQPSVEAAVRLTIGNSYRSLGEFAAAREHVERAVELLGGVEARDTDALAAITNLGVLYQQLGMYERSEQLLGSVLQTRRDTLGEEHPDTLTSMSHLANLLWAQGRFDEVEVLDRKTLEIRRKVLGEEHPDTIRSINAVASTLFNKGRYAEAAKLFEQALAVRQRTLGERHPDTLQASNNLAAAYLELGLYGQAELLFRQLIEVQTQVLGESHPGTILSVHNLGVTLAQQARYAEAEEQLQRAMAVRKTYPGEERSYLFSKSYLANVLRDEGRLEEAETLYLDTLEQQRERFGLEDENTLKTTSELVKLRVKQGRLAEAEELLQQLREPYERVLGTQHPDFVLNMKTLAQIRIEQGRFADALRLTDQAIEIASSAFGSDHYVVLEVVATKIDALRGLNRRDEARQLAARLYEQRLQLLGEQHPLTIETLTLRNQLER